MNRVRCLYDKIRMNKQEIKLLKRTKMKTITTKWAMLIALMTAVSRTETETGIEPEPGSGDGQVALGINPNLKVDAGTRASTKSVVSGSAITYTDYSTAPGLGIVVTNPDATGWYSPDVSSSGYTGHHVWYIGNTKGENWISIESKGLSYDPKSEKPYYLTETVGKVYAYYPYDENALSSLSNISGESSLKIPVSVSTSGSIDAATNNANKYWNNTTWAPNNTNKAINLSDTGEKDYLYFAAEGGGRYVNNGRAKNQTPFDPEQGPKNTDADNPGYLINLDMKHAMAMVSFRVYDGGNLSSNDVKFTKFVIKNHDGSSNSYIKTGNGKMSLSDGTISDNTTTSTLTRNITNYILMKQIKDGEQSDKAFIENKSTVNGQLVSKKVSAIVYPVASFGENEIDVVITLQEGGNAAVDYTVTLPAYQWPAGTNCIYTFSAGRNKLTVMDVTVTEWEEDEPDDIPL